MKKAYILPTIEQISLRMVDVITLSENIPGETGEVLTPDKVWD